MARSAFSPFIFQLPATSGLMLRVTSFLRKLSFPGCINARLAPQSHVNRKGNPRRRLRLSPPVPISSAGKSARGPVSRHEQVQGRQFP
jgi:hypothetical protein